MIFEGLFMNLRTLWVRKRPSIMCARILPKDWQKRMSVLIPYRGMYVHTYGISCPIYAAFDAFTESSRPNGICIPFRANRH